MSAPISNYYALGIVGSEGRKFTPYTEQLARTAIRNLITDPFVCLVISGGCHLGGIDIWAVEEARKLKVPYIEHKPRSLSWETGYKPRNILIAEDSDKVACITLANLPVQYTGMRFDCCYHCHTTDHVKSGGCWTVKYAKSLGKLGEVIVIKEP